MVTPFVKWVEGGEGGGRRRGRKEDLTKKAPIPHFYSCLPFLTKQADAQDISMVICEESHGSRGRGQKKEKRFFPRPLGTEEKGKKMHRTHTVLKVLFQACAVGARKECERKKIAGRTRESLILFQSLFTPFRTLKRCFVYYTFNNCPALLFLAKTFSDFIIMSRKRKVT